MADNNFINIKIFCAILNLYDAEAVARFDGYKVMQTVCGMPLGIFDAVCMNIQISEMNR
ncbi:MAG: hypothetical protein HUJ74_03095 [Lachnospiraceae bacterium]|nr:hypothetical protein [Lachnospiraceae bacterium]